MFDEPVFVYFVLDSPEDWNSPECIDEPFAGEEPSSALRFLTIMLPGEEDKIVGFLFKVAE